MLGGWSSIIDPIQLADKGARLSGELPLKGMSRLAEMCRDDRGTVRIDLQFDRAPIDGVRTAEGTIAANVNLTCQRCMERMPFTLTSRPRLLLLHPGERDDLVEDGNALIIEHPVTLGDFVENELLLEMPMVPMHALEACPAKQIVEQPLSRESASTTEEPKEPKSSNPFSVLARLKRSND